MAKKQVGWMTIQQAAIYLGVSERGLKYAVKLKKENLANHSLVLKSYGNRTLIRKKSIDDTENITIKAPQS